MSNVPDQSISYLTPEGGVWDFNLKQIKADHELMRKRQASAEHDRELFRDLYNRASSHASEVSKENEELLERVAIAEGQAKDGVAMIKSTYEGRLSQLERTIKELKVHNAILAARDIHGDAMRREAAQAQELRVENQKLRAELAALRMDYHRVLSMLGQHSEEESEQSSEQDEESMD
jgi:hypothetical protein